MAARDPAGPCWSCNRSCDKTSAPGYWISLRWRTTPPDEKEHREFIWAEEECLHREARILGLLDEEKLEEKETDLPLSDIYEEFREADSLC